MYRAVEVAAYSWQPGNVRNVVPTLLNRVSASYLYFYVRHNCYVRATQKVETHAKPIAIPRTPAPIREPTPHRSTYQASIANELLHPHPQSLCNVRSAVGPIQEPTRHNDAPRRELRPKAKHSTKRPAITPTGGGQGSIAKPRFTLRASLEMQQLESRRTAVARNTP